MNSLFQTVPDGWQRTPLHYLVDGPKNGAWGSEENEDDKNAICVRVADFDWSRLTLNFRNQTTRSFKMYQFKNLQLYPGDILIEKSGGGEKTPVGRVVSFNENIDAVSSNFVARIRPRDGVFKRYFLYLLAAHYMSGYSRQFIKQNTGIQNLDDTNLFRSDVWIPDLLTQRAIADFLDRETARIDSLIKKKQRLVELLGEKRGALITVAVTGKHPHNSGDSGGRDYRYIKVTYWDPSIHKIVRPLKHCCHVNPTVLPETTDPDWEFNYIDIGSVSLSEGVTHKERIRFADSPSSARQPVQEQDILVSTVRTYLKAIAVVEPSETPQVASIGFAVLRSRQGTDPRFLYRAVQSNPFVDQAVSQSKGICYPSINSTTLSNIGIPIPDLPTQRTIADFLDRETARIDKIIERTRISIDRLKEYRAALITAAVTGQINVSTYAMSRTTDRQLGAIQSEM